MISSTATPNTAQPQGAAILPPDFATYVAPRTGWAAEPDGRVYEMKKGRKQYIPPWLVWQASASGYDANGRITEDGLKWRTMSSDPRISNWSSMYQSSGPFRNQSAWNPDDGTFNSSFQWLDFVMALVVGGIITGGVTAAIATASAGAGGAAAGGAAAGTLPSTTIAPAMGTLPAGVASGTGLAAGGTGAAAGGAAAGGLVGAGEAAVESSPLAASAAPSTLGGVTSSVQSGSGPIWGSSISNAAGGVGGGTGTGAGTGGKVAGLSPEMWRYIIGAGGGALNSIVAGNKQQEISREDNRAAMERLRAQLAAQESGLDPFRDQMWQMDALNRLSSLENFQSSPRVHPTGPYASVIPPQPPSVMPSAELIAWAAKMKRDIAGGRHTAPTQTNPDNYGRRSTVDLMGGNL